MNSLELATLASDFGLGIKNEFGVLFIQKTADNEKQQLPFDQLIRLLTAKGIEFSVRDYREETGWHETLIQVPLPLAQRRENKIDFLLEQWVDDELEQAL